VDNYKLSIGALIKLNAAVTSSLLADMLFLVDRIYCFHGTILDLCQENLVALSGESCSSSREPGNDISVQLHQ
jgi:hypothetical protein